MQRHTRARICSAWNQKIVQEVGFSWGKYSCRMSPSYISCESSLFMTHLQYASILCYISDLRLLCLKIIDEHCLPFAELETRYHNKKFVMQLSVSSGNSRCFQHRILEASSQHQKKSKRRAWAGSNGVFWLHCAEGISSIWLAKQFSC